MRDCVVNVEEPEITHETPEQKSAFIASAGSVIGAVFVLTIVSACLIRRKFRYILNEKNMYDSANS